eukprot:TRINITY_DN7097_c0_g1_i2.p3 TRINITY_DN7097_c0_g1~~TRINITY_DN7097_c0_g1_i2.p3  ORF type:complete len:216 (+),score=29.22 TRINITY_DN7097_c0_g1_i2:937-1584(+)
MKLPPPMPTFGQQKKWVKQTESKKQVSEKQVNEAPVQQPSFADYYDCGGGCFAGWSQLLLANGNEINIKDLVKGNIVQTPHGCSKIKTILKIHCPRPILLTKLNKNLSLTPKHPIFYNNKWQKPFTLFKKQIISTDYLYNIVLEKEHQVRVGGVWCVTLGHGIRDKEAQHQYFGTGKVVRELERAEGSEEGVVVVGVDQFVRNQEGQVCGLKLSK